MATLQAERTAVEALRAYLLRTLPAKVDAINLARVAVLRAPRAGPYTFPANATLALGSAKGSEPLTAVTGVLTAAQLVTALAAVPGLVCGADAQERFYATATQLPTGDTRSVVSLGADVTGANLALGFDPGGDDCIRAAIAAPLGRGVFDGWQENMSFGQGLQVVIGQRTTEPRSPNLREDISKVTMAVEVLAAEPDSAVDRGPEFIEACARAVREVIAEDPTLDSAVFKTEPPRVQFAARSFQFNKGSVLLCSAEFTLRIHVFERT